MTQSHAVSKSFLLAFLLAAAAPAGCNQQTPPGGLPGAGPPEVAVVTVKPERLVLTTELTGRTVSPLVAEVRPQVSGIIQKRSFAEGTDVAAGQPLYEIDPAPFRAALDNAAAGLAAAQKNAERAQAALQATGANLARQEAALELARTNASRLEAAYAQGAVAARDRDQAATDLQMAEAGLRAAKAQLQSDEKALAAAQAAVLQAEAGLKTARINLAYTTVSAPISGRIGRSTVTVGALVTAHQPTALAVIQQIDPIYVDVPQSTADLLKLRQRLEEGRIHQEGRMKVRLRLDDGSQYRWEGLLQFRDITVDPSTGSVALRILFPNPRGILLPGMFVRALVEEGVTRQALLVPQQAVLRDPKGNALVLVVGADAVVQQRLLTIDRAVGDRWLVTAGLAAGEQVIVEGTQKVRPGMPVKTVVQTSQGSGPAGSVPPAGR